MRKPRDVPCMVECLLNQVKVRAKIMNRVKVPRTSDPVDDRTFRFGHNDDGCPTGIADRRLLVEWMSERSSEAERLILCRRRRGMPQDL